MSATVRIKLSNALSLKASKPVNGLRRWSIAESFSAMGCVKKFQKLSSSSSKLNFPPARCAYLVKVSTKDFPALETSSQDVIDQSVGKARALERLKNGAAFATLAIMLMVSFVLLCVFSPKTGTADFLTVDSTRIFSLLGPGVVLLPLAAAIFLLLIIINFLCDLLDVFYTPSYIKSFGACQPKLVEYAFSGWFNDAYAAFEEKIKSIRQSSSSLPNDAKRRVFSASQDGLFAMQHVLVDMCVVSQSLDEFLAANPILEKTTISANFNVLSRAHDRLVVLEDSFNKLFYKFSLLEKEVVSLTASIAAIDSKVHLQKAVGFSKVNSFETTAALSYNALESVEDFIRASSLALKGIDALVY